MVSAVASTDTVLDDRWVELRQTLVDRVKLTIAGGLVLGIIGIGLSDAGGPSAALLDIALLCLALWLGRSSALAPVLTRAPASNSAMTGNQALLLVLALGGAAVLITAGAASRPLHGLAVAPFAMAAFALSSQNSRDLRSGVLAAAASLLVLSAADSRAVVMTLCALGLVPLVFSWAAVRQLMTLDRFPDLALALSRLSRPWPFALVARLVVLTAVLALLMPTEPAPHLPGGGSGTGSGDQTGSASGARGGEIGGSDGALDLRNRGSLDSKPVLDVPAATPTLWQGGYVDSYDGGSWSRTFSGNPGAGRAVGSDHVALRSDGGFSVAEVRRLQPGGDLVYSPGPLIAVDVAGGAHAYDLGTGSIGLGDLSDPLLSYTIEYRDNGTTSTGSLTHTLPPVTDPRWLQLPAELPSRVRDLARTVTASAATTQDKVAALETYLRTHEKYALDSPVPAEGTDAVDAFLFTDHVGFCEQFASAETVMLRALGIPARVATGYGGSGVADGDRRTYRNQDAHAWVQVGYTGDRWVNSDPTAGSQAAPGSLQHRLEAWFKQLWKDLTGSATARRLSAIGLLALAVAVVLLYRALRRTRRSRTGPAKGGTAGVVLETPAGKAYQRLLGRLAAQNRPRLPTETVRDVLFRLGARDRDAVVAVLEAEWYGRPTTFPAQLVGLVVGVLDSLAVEPPASASP